MFSNQCNGGNPLQDQHHCHLLLILSAAPPFYLILSYLILSHLLLILSVTPAEEPLGHQHQQEERSHRANLGV